MSEEAHPEVLRLVPRDEALEAVGEEAEEPVAAARVDLARDRDLLDDGLVLLYSVQCIV